MADQADVETALAAIAANAVYPAGTAAASAVGAAAKIYRGWPVAPVLDADLAAGIAHVSVSATDGAVKNVTRYPRVWQNLAPASGTLAASVNGLTANFFGTCSAGLLAGVMVDGETYPYAVQANDSAATVTSNLAALLRQGGWIVEYAGTTLAVPEATRFAARVVAGAGALQEIRRQEQEFRVAMWCPCPALRDTIVPVADAALMANDFIALADGSYGRIRFANGMTTDASADAALYRRDLIYTVEYPTTLAQMTPAMLFGTMTATVNTVVLATDSV
ncbi:MAG: hypothetical protein KGQ79_05020 [Proteobacteria bacterium]|nr:hypothetical protein [Pseudomonadota bacterium]MBU6425872.1 hypothetical protein [Rhodospirillales bacterium]